MRIRRLRPRRAGGALPLGWRLRAPSAGARLRAMPPSKPTARPPGASTAPGSDGHRADGAAAPSRPDRLRALARSDTGRAAGLGAATLANMGVALVTTVVFAHLLGASDYGSLGALLAAFIVLMVPGSAVQAAVAREVSAGLAGGETAPAAAVRHWLARLLLGLVAVAAVAALARDVVAAVVGVDEAWAAAAIVPTGWLWLILSVERGALQGFHRYRGVGLSLIGEAVARLAFGVALVVAGAEVVGAFLATTLSLAATSLALAVPLRRALAASGGAAAPGAGRRLRDLLAPARVPIAAFALIGLLQHGDVIVVKHLASDTIAGSYAAVSVAGKAIVWLGIGLGMFVLPEAVRRARAGEDPRPILARTLGLIALAAAPLTLVYAVAGRPVIGLVFGEDLTGASDALPLLGAAMALLSGAYLAVQYLLALGRWRFVLLLAAAVVVELAVLLRVGGDVVEVALTLLAVEAALFSAVLLTAWRSAWRRPPAGAAERVAEVPPAAALDAAAP